MTTDGVRAGGRVRIVDPSGLMSNWEGRVEAVAPDEHGVEMAVVRFDQGDALCLRLATLVSVPVETTFGRELAACRLARAVKQRTAAKQIGLTPSRLADLEAGRQRPTVSVLSWLAAYYLWDGETTARMLRLAAAVRPRRPAGRPRSG